MGTKTNITTAAGVVYSNAVVMRVEPDGLTLMLSTGIMKISFTNLTADTQAAYGYDPVKAAAFKADQDRLAASKAQALKARQVLEKQMAGISEEKFSGKVSDISADSALGWKQWIGSTPPSDGEVAARVAVAQATGGSTFGIAAGTPTLMTAENPVVIFGLPRTLVDGSHWEGTIYGGDIVQYKDSSGRTRTVKRYATTRELAARLLLQDK